MAINAKSFLIPINLNKNEIRQAVLENSGTAPSSPVKGQIYYDSTNNLTYVHNGTTWEELLVSGAVVNADISSSAAIANSKLANSTITLGSSTLTLGSTTTSVSGLTLSLPTIGGTGAVFSGSSSGTTTVLASAVAGTTTITLPATTGTVITTGDTGTVTNTMLAGSIANSKLANSTITLGSSTLTLGSTTTSVTSLTLVTPTVGGAGATFNGSTSGTTVLKASATAGTTTVTMPATTGTIITTGDSGTVTNTMLAGSIANAKLANSTITLGSSTLTLGSTTSSVSGLTLSSPTLTTPAVGSGGFTIAGTSSGTTTIVTSAAASGTVTIPAGTSTLITSADSGTVTNTMLAGSIANAKLANSSVTIGSTSVSLGGTATTFTGVTSINGTTIPSSKTLVVTTDTLAALAATTSAQLAGVLSDETGYSAGAVAVFSINPSITGATFTGTVTVPTPVNNTDAANKAYVDNVAQGVNAHDAVQYATTTTLAATYSAGTTGADGGTGVGATITFSSTGTQSIDGGSNLALNDRVLVKNGVTAASGTSSIVNGIYYVTTAPAVGVAGVLTRSLDADNSIAGDITAGDLVYVIGGTSNGGSQWVQTATGTATTPNKGIKIGTDGITWTQFSGASSTTAGAGLVANGSAFDVGTASTARIVVNADNIDLATTAVTAGSYGSSTGIATFTVDAYGRLTAASNVAYTDATTSVKGIASFSSSNFTVSSGAVSISNVANTVISGILATTQGGLGYSPTLTANTAFYVNSSGTGITNGTLPVTAGGTGATTAAGARSNLGVAGKYTANNASITVVSSQATWSIPQSTHGLTASGGYIVQVKDLSTNSNVEVDVQINDSTGDVTLGWNSASNVSANSYRVTIIG